MELPITDALAAHPYFRQCLALSESYENKEVAGPDVLVEAGELMEAVDQDSSATAQQRRDAKALLNFVAPNKSEFTELSCPGEAWKPSDSHFRDCISMDAGNVVSAACNVSLAAVPKPRTHAWVNARNARGTDHGAFSAAARCTRPRSRWRSSARHGAVHTRCEPE